MEDVAGDTEEEEERTEFLLQHIAINTRLGQAEQLCKDVNHIFYAKSK